ncbi:TPA: GTP pyrophosphokinase, partial [Raoultella ornithinolytica]
MENNNVSADYMVNYGIANEFKKSLVDQIERVLMESDITLGVPIESRVKDLDSLMEKLERKEIDIEKVSDLDDLIGLRVILLFKRDLDLVTKCLKETFIILHEEDKLDVLEEDKFGYQSRHYIIKVPDEWLKLPTYSKFGEFKAEIQVRTLAQHIWAAASHKLQYKHEKSVPPQLRRAINRASAVLEVIDLEFERILID